MDWFENWFDSPFYKILYNNRDDREAQKFTDQLICYLTPPAGSSMLDIACGEGRFSLQLAEKGYDVTGIDISANSIEHAKTHETNHLHFYVQDMRFPFYINYFDFAFNFFTSFGYFKYDRDHRMAARSFAGALKKGGILVIDYFNYKNVLKSMVNAADVEREEITFHITKKFERKHIIKDIKFTDQQNIARHFTESVATFSLEDFVEMFSAAGLTLIETFGDYQLAPYHPEDTPRMIMIFKKH